MVDFTGMDFGDVVEWLETQSEDSIASDIYLLWNQLAAAQKRIAELDGELKMLKKTVFLDLYKELGTMKWIAVREYLYTATSLKAALDRKEDV